MGLPFLTRCSSFNGGLAFRCAAFLSNSSYENHEMNARTRMLESRHAFVLIHLNPLLIHSCGETAVRTRS